MPSPTLLITGATGFIGFKVLLDALEAGYVVRAAVRSNSKAEFLASHPKIKAQAPGDKLSFVSVPDITSADAYDEAVKGVSYVIHLAASVPTPPFLDPQTGYYEPAVKGATNILHSALKVPSIKKVVITNSIYGNLDVTADGTDEITPESRLPDVQGPIDSHLMGYCAGKINSLNAVDRFVKENKPRFDVVKILPSFVFGRDERAHSVRELNNSTNRFVLSIIAEKYNEEPIPLHGVAAHIHDTSRLHLLALNEGVVGNLGITTPTVFDDAWEVIKRRFPKAVQDGTLSQGPPQPTLPVIWNSHKTEVDLGINFMPYEEMVVDLASQYLELCGKEKA